jgi:hypothetical protein
MPGLEARLAEDAKGQPEVIADPVPATPEQQIAALLLGTASLSEALTAAKSEVEMWKGKFKNTDAHVAELQTEIAQIKALIPPQ